MSSIHKAQYVIQCDQLGIYYMENKNSTSAGRKIRLLSTMTTLQAYFNMHTHNIYYPWLSLACLNDPADINLVLI